MNQFMKLFQSSKDTLKAAVDSASTDSSLAEEVTSISLQPTELWNSFLTHLPQIGRVVLILLLLWIIYVAAGRAISRVIRRMQTGKAKTQRSATIGAVLRSVLNITILALATTLVLSELGVNLGPLLAAAGVVGLAIGFGAQSLVRDVLNGMFLLFEGQVRIGDVVRAAGIAGLVEEITLRTMQLRDFEGNYHVIPHGEITTLTNMTKEYSRALVHIGVAYREDPARVMEVLDEEAKALYESEEHGGLILEEPEIYGVDDFLDSAVLFKVRFKTMPIEQWNVARAFRKRVKARFDREDIEIPFPHLTMYWGQDKDGQAPPLQMQQFEKQAG